MGMFDSFCKHMRNRSFQYMVRSTYDVLDGNKPGRDSYSYNIPEQQPKREKQKSVRAKKPAEPLDKNGKKIREYTCVEYNGEKKLVVRTTPKKVYFRDGECMANKVVSLA